MVINSLEAVELLVDLDLLSIALFESSVEQIGVRAVLIVSRLYVIAVIGRCVSLQVVNVQLLDDSWVH